MPDPATDPPVAARRPRRVPRWAKVLLGCAIALGIFAVCIPFIAGWIIKTKLQSMVSSHLNATLDVGSITYYPPYRVSVANASLVTPGPDGSPLELLAIDSLQLRLAELPRKGKPLVIERFDIGQPTVHLIKTQDGIYGSRNLVKPKEKKKAPDGKPAPRLSEMLRLRHFRLDDGQITFEDRTRPGTVPLVWRKLNVDVDTRPASASSYDYDFTADNSPVANLSSSGRFDVDELVLDAKKLVLDARADSKDEKDSPLPAPLQRLVNRYNVAGDVRFTSVAIVPLTHAGDSVFSATVDLSRATADHPDWPAPLDEVSLRVQSKRDTVDAPIEVAVSNFLARSGTATLQFDRGIVRVDPAQKSWQLAKLNGVVEGRPPVDPSNEPTSAPASAPVAATRAFASTTAPAATRPSRMAQINQAANLARRFELAGRIEFTAAAHGFLPVPGQPVPIPAYELLAYARRASFTLPMLDQPIRRINGGPVQLVDNAVTIENLSATYSYDVVQINRARIPLEQIGQRQSIGELDITATIDRNSGPYPRPLDRAVALLHPAGTFQLAGAFARLPKGSVPRFAYNLALTSDDASLAVTDYLLPLEHVRTDITARSDAVQVRRFNADSLGGKVVATATLSTAGLGTPSFTLAYDAQGSIEGVDLRKAFALYQEKQGAATKPNSRVSGDLFANFRVQNTGGGLDQLKADGAFEVVKAEFFGAPVLSDVAKASKMGDGAFTGSEAAGVFEVADKTVYLRNAAVGAPAVGVQGGGTVEFDGDLNLQLVVAPLNDWKEKLKETGIPLIGDVAGAVQGAINKATRTLLYEFHVTGNAKEPKVTPVPVPVLSKGAASLFTTMIRPEGKKESLGSQVKKLGSAFDPRKKPADAK